MIQRQGQFFSIATQRTVYCFQVTEQGFLQHLHYGRKIDLSAGWQALVPQVRHFPGNAAVLDGTCLEDTALEVSLSDGALRVHGSAYVMHLTRSGGTITINKLTAAQHAVQ